MNTFAEGGIRSLPTIAPLESKKLEITPTNMEKQLADYKIEVANNICQNKDTGNLETKTNDPNRNEAKTTTICTKKGVCEKRPAPQEIPPCITGKTNEVDSTAEERIAKANAAFAEKIETLDESLKEIAKIFSENFNKDIVQILPSKNEYPKKYNPEHITKLKVGEKSTEEVEDNSAAQAQSETSQSNTAAASSETIEKLNNEAANLKQIDHEINGRFFSQGMDGSFHKLLRKRNRLVRFALRCISDTEIAESTCDKARSSNGKRAAKVMSQLSSATRMASPAFSGNQSISTVLTGTIAAFEGAKLYFSRAQIKCNSKLEDTISNCNSAENAARDIEEEIKSLATSVETINKSAVEYNNVTLPKKMTACKETSCVDQLQKQNKSYQEIVNRSQADGTIQAKLKKINTIKNDIIDSPIKSNQSRLDLITAGPSTEYGTLISMVAQGASQATNSLKQISSSSNPTVNSISTQTLSSACSDPSSSQNSYCKCAQDNTAPGCPGYIAALSSASSTLQKASGSGGVSAMAGFSAKSKDATVDSKNTGLDNLSEEAKKSLLAGGSVANPSHKSSLDAFGSASSSASGSGSLGSSDLNTQKGDDSKSAQEKSSSLTQTFSKAVGSFFNGSFFGGGKQKNNASSKTKADAYKTDIKRAIANEQIRSEVSNASGTSNWEKVKLRYKSNTELLINN